MKTVKEMREELLLDKERRQQIEQEQLQKKITLQQNVAMAEKEMAQALARQDQEGYHAAEGKLSYTKEVLRRFQLADAWWTENEAVEIVKAAFLACGTECKEKYKQIFTLMKQAELLLGEIHSIMLTGHSISSILNNGTPKSFGYGFELSQKRIPYEFMMDIARRAGETYAPPKGF